MNNEFLAQTDHIGYNASDFIVLAGAHILENSKFKNQINQKKRQSFKKSGTGCPNVYVFMFIITNVTIGGP